jgi:hypothetical protein
VSPRLVSSHISSQGGGLSSLSREVKLRAKHVNTCSNDLEATTKINPRALQISHIDRGRLYELNDVKIIVLYALEVDIINKHPFTHYPGLVHQVPHIK